MALGMGYQSGSDPIFQQIMLRQDERPEASMTRGVGGIRPLDKQEIAAQVEAEMLDSIGAYGSPVHEQRRINIRRYYGKPFGNEVEGQSQAQITSVADTIEWMQPSHVKAFFGAGHNIWDFQPTRPGEEEGAEQASDAVTHVFLNECHGFEKFMDITKTANLEKRGFAAVYFEERMEPKKTTHRGITESALGLLVSDPNVELTAFAQHEGEIVLDELGMPVETFDVTVRRVTPLGRIRIDSIAPEHMLLPRRETELNEETRFSGYRKKMTVGDLVSLGFPADVVSMLPSDNKAEYSEGRIERLYDENSFPTNLQDRTDGASRQLWVNFIWMRIDEDGDGYAELRNIVCIGDTSIQIIYDEETTYYPLVSLCPIPMPHKFFGMCPADQAVDQQVIESTLLRQMLDNTYRINNGRYEVVSGQVNMRDLMDNKPGGGVRVTALGMIKALDTPALPNTTFELLNFMQKAGERRTGVSQWQQGPDAADMKYQTASAVSGVATASESKITLINRIFAETGIKDIGKKILQLMCENFMIPYVYRLRGKWVECDPRDWNKDMDATVRTGLGVGEMEAKTGKLLMVAELQEKMLREGLRNMVTPRNLYATVKEFVKISDLGPEGMFFTDPGPDPWPEPQPKLEDQVKVMESQRRQVADQNKDNQQTMDLAVRASGQENIAEFRYAELAQKSQLEIARLAAQEKNMRIQVEGQLQAALANRQQRQAA